MKKSTIYLMILMVLLTCFPASIMAAESTPITPAPTSSEMPAEVKIMLNRLEEIKEMDKSDLSSKEKKALRKEVRSIKAELRSTGNGVYLSVGAIIIIILLLILLL